jgi:hypothetical protein
MKHHGCSGARIVVLSASFSEKLVLNIFINPLNAELNPICHLLALLGARHILHVSRIRVNSELCCLHTFIYSLRNEEPMFFVA